MPLSTMGTRGYWQLSMIQNPLRFALSTLLAVPSRHAQMGDAGHEFAVASENFFDSFPPVLAAYREIGHEAGPRAAAKPRRPSHVNKRSGYMVGHDVARPPDGIDLIIAGAAKSGTSSLLAAFSQHPAGWAQRRSGIDVLPR